MYNAENRPVTFTNSESNTVVECQYDSMGRRAYKKVTVNGNVTLHQCYIYRGYLQIACIDLTRSHHPVMWLVTWDPTQPISTRPLAIRKDGTWFAYGWDFTKNVCEVFGPAGYIRTNYTYSPYGVVNASGDVEQAIQWSSEFFDTELALVYYNYRHYNPMDGCWTTRDYIEERGGKNLYKIGSPIITTDILGAWGPGINGQLGHISKRGHSDFEGNEPNGPFDYNLEDTDDETKPTNPKATWRHFRPLQESEKDLTLATKHCNKLDYERYAHQMQDFFAHYGQGFRANKYDYSMGDAIWAAIILMVSPLNMDSLIKVINYPYGHGPATIIRWPFPVPQPDNAEHYYDAYQQAAERSSMWYAMWTKCCCYEKGNWIPIKDSTGKPLCADLEQPANPYGESAAPPAMPPTPSRHNQQMSPTELKGFSIYI